MFIWQFQMSYTIGFPCPIWKDGGFFPRRATSQINIFALSLFLSYLTSLCRRDLEANLCSQLFWYINIDVVFLLRFIKDMANYSNISSNYTLESGQPCTGDHLTNPLSVLLDSLIWSVLVVISDGKCST